MHRMFQKIDQNLQGYFIKIKMEFLLMMNSIIH
jgi:hypothetical protein